MMKCFKQQTFTFLLLSLTIYSSECAIDVKASQKSALNIVVIGGGPTGLCSARHSIAQGYNVTIYEQQDELGGVWVYTDEVGKNKYGLNVHTAMYQELRANGPTQLTEFPDLFFPNDTIPFPPHSDVLKYLHSYANLFDLNKHIKLNHYVVRVLPIENDKWEVIVKDLQNNKFITKIYDAVFVCSGSFFAPFIPEFEGASEFKGKLMHSHDFRTSETFRGENVLIIGAGTSGIDLLIHLIKVAESVTLSRRKKLNETDEMYQKYQSSLPPKTILRGVVKRFTAEGVEFEDRSKQSFSVIIYATGYKNSYPFLSVDSAIHVDENYVTPLYKHIFNIEHPTMAFIGITKSSLNYYLFDLQVRFALKYLSGEKKLPTKSEMLKDQRIAAESMWQKGYPKRKTHSILSIQREYFDQLSSLAEIENVPKILDAVAADAIIDLREKPTEFRKYKFNIIDNKTYTKIKYEN